MSVYVEPQYDDEFDEDEDDRATRIQELEAELAELKAEQQVEAPEEPEYVQPAQPAPGISPDTAAKLKAREAKMLQDMENAKSQLERDNLAAAFNFDMETIAQDFDARPAPPPLERQPEINARIQAAQSQEEVIKILQEEGVPMQQGL